MLDDVLINYSHLLYLNSPSIDSSLGSNFVGKIVATDGAYTRLKKEGVLADLVVGDFDSVAQSNVLCKTHVSINQNKTDFQKALDLLIHQNISSCLISGIMGGQSDHVLGNCMILSTYCARIKLLGYHEEEGCKQLLWPMQQGEYTILGQKGQKLSIISFEPCTLSTHGLKWELSSYKIKSRGPYSLRNEIVENQVQFKIFEGFALVIQSFSN